jgi:hypothetical protein
MNCLAISEAEAALAASLSAPIMIFSFYDYDFLSSSFRKSYSLKDPGFIIFDDPGVTGD